jgi:hypothetical protein
MAFSNGDTIVSYYRPKHVVHKLSAADASSGEVIFSDYFGTGDDASVIASVVSSAGAPRTLTKVITVSGVVDVAGSSFAAGDKLIVTGFKYQVV